MDLDRWLVHMLHDPACTEPGCDMLPHWAKNISRIVAKSNDDIREEIRIMREGFAEILDAVSQISTTSTAAITVRIRVGLVRDQDTGDVATTQPEGHAMQLKDSQQVDYNIEADDAKGQAVSADTFSASVDNPSVVTINQEGSKFTAVAGTPGSAVVTFTDGTRSVTEAIDVVPGDVATIKVTPGTPTDQPSAAPSTPASAPTDTPAPADSTTPAPTDAPPAPASPAGGVDVTSGASTDPTVTDPTAATPSSSGTLPDPAATDPTASTDAPAAPADGSTGVAGTTTTA